MNNMSNQDASDLSVRHLAGLYTVTIAAATVSTVYRNFDLQMMEPDVDWSAIKLGVALIFTLIPFYHGALRHLDQTYILSGTDSPKSGALLLDFLLLFAHGILFVILSLLQDQPFYFVIVYLVILAIDAFWGLVGHLAYSSGPAHQMEWRWGILNLVTVILGLLFLSAVADHQLEPIIPSVILVGALIRTVIDYCIAWKSYFPK